MSERQWEQDVDETKDYYKALGVSQSATPDELKTAYVQLALQHHPDTAEPVGDPKSKNAAFINVSEAWSVLSRPEVRLHYDVLRGRYLGIDGKFGSMKMNHMADSVHSEIPIGYNTQKVNFGRVKHHAGATVEDTLERSRTERWKSEPLSKKKMHRTQPIASFHTSGLSMLVPIVVLGAVVYGAYRLSKKESR